MLVIFIVDSAGVCEMAHAGWQHMVGIERRVSDLEQQKAVLELALHEMLADPGNPVSSASRAREILAILEG